VLFAARLREGVEQVVVATDAAGIFQRRPPCATQEPRPWGVGWGGEHLTLRIIAISFFALAAFVTVDSVRSLTGGGEAQHSTPGIVIAALSLAIMPVLSWLQRRAGRELGSRTAVADSKQTLLCTYLSAVLLVGLVLNSTLGWWWADAGAALVSAAIAIREGINAWRGGVCCTVPHGQDAPNAEADDCCAAPEMGAGAGRVGAAGLIRTHA
jgi:hypothetical protein